MTSPGLGPRRKYLPEAIATTASGCLAIAEQIDRPFFSARKGRASASTQSDPRDTLVELDQLLPAEMAL